MALISDVKSTLPGAPSKTVHTELRIKGPDSTLQFSVAYHFLDQPQPASHPSLVAGPKPLLLSFRAWTTDPDVLKFMIDWQKETMEAVSSLTGPVGPAAREAALIRASVSSSWPVGKQETWLLHGVYLRDLDFECAQPYEKCWFEGTCCINTAEGPFVAEDAYAPGGLVGPSSTPGVIDPGPTGEIGPEPPAPPEFLGFPKVAAYDMGVGEVYGDTGPLPYVDGPACATCATGFEEEYEQIEAAIGAAGFLTEKGAETLKKYGVKLV